MVRSEGLVEFEVDLPVESSPSLLQAGMRQRAPVRWAPLSRWTGFRSWGCVLLTLWRAL